MKLNMNMLPLLCLPHPYFLPFHPIMQTAHHGNHAYATGWTATAAGMTARQKCCHTLQCILRRVILLRYYLIDCKMTLRLREIHISLSECWC